MKNKIKKRVDGNKKNTSGLVFLWTIFFILLVACGVLYLNKDNLVELFTKDKVVVDKTGMVYDKNEKMVKVDIDSPNIKHLFNLVHKDFVAVDSVIYKNKKLTVEEMDDFYKFSLASNLYSGVAVRNNYAQENQITAYLDEEVVKDYYEVVFGKGTYKQAEKIPYSCTDMYYDTVHRRYVTTNQVCGSISPFSAYEKIIDAKKDDEHLYITGAVVFAEGFTGSLCKDEGCENVIDNYPSNMTDENYFYEYIDKNKDKLMNYTYTFKLNDDGFYYYQGFERTKE